MDRIASWRAGATLLIWLVGESKGQQQRQKMIQINFLRNTCATDEGSLREIFVVHHAPPWYRKQGRSLTRPPQQPPDDADRLRGLGPQVGECFTHRGRVEGSHRAPEDQAPTFKALLLTRQRLDLLERQAGVRR